MKLCSDDNDVIAGCSMFQSFAVATGKALNGQNVSVIMARRCVCVFIDGLPKTLDRLKGKGKTLRMLDCKPGMSVIEKY